MLLYPLGLITFYTTYTLNDAATLTTAFGHVGIISINLITPVITVIYIIIT